jgi:putative transposase
MTTRWRPDFDPDELYFLTTTTAHRMHIFKRDVLKRLILDSLYFTTRLNSVSLYAFVVMPNHVHLIVQFPCDVPPKDWARVFKSSSAQLIVRMYQVEENQAALDTLSSLVTRPEKQQYKVWEDGYLSKSVFTPEFLRQKLTYIHNNPVQSHWQLAAMPEAYVWSSARFYLEELPCIIPVHDVRELLV